MTKHRPACTPRWPLAPLPQAPHKTLLSAILACALASPALAVDRTWSGGNGDWGIDTNWTPAGVPGVADRAVLNLGTATLSTASTVAALDLGGGALSGTGDLTVSGASMWSAGTVAGAASITFASDVAISGANLKVIVGGSIVNLNGSTTWIGNTANDNNAIRFWNGATVNNNGVFNDANAFASFIEHNVGGPHNFNNVGIYNKQSATITTVDIGVAFNNTGTVNVNAGTFRPAGGTSSGSFAIAATATLNFMNGNNVLNNVSTSGQGTFHISSDNVGADALVTLNGGSHTTAFVLSGSTLAGTDHSFQGQATWSGGAISGAASTTFANDVAISGPNLKTIVGGRVVNLTGTTTWSGNTADNNNAIRFWNGATINNTGTFNDANAFASFIEHSVGGPHHFNNIGTYNKTADTITTVDLGVAFNNTGTVNLNAGTFRPTGGTSSGSFNIAAGAILDFRNGSNVLNNVTTSGAGTLQTSTDNVGADGVLTLNGGTHTTRVLLSGGALTGSDHSFQGPATWTGGSISGAASTTFANDLTIAGAGTKVIVAGRSVNLLGTTTWSGNTVNNNNAIRFWNGATLNNHGTFNDANAFASFIEHNTGGPHSFNNIGTYNKLSDTLTTVDLGVAFNNTGTLNVTAGTFQIVSAHTNRGLVNVAAGAVFLGSSASFVNAGTVAGTGTLATHASGDVANDGNINPGFGIGQLTLDGDLNQRASGALNFELATLASFDTLAVTDDVTLAGSIVAWNAGYVPVVGDRFVVLSFDTRLGNSSFDTVGTSGFAPGVTFAAIYNPHDVTLVVVTIPEPQTALMLLTGLAAITGLSLRRRRKADAACSAGQRVGSA